MSHLFRWALLPLLLLVACQADRLLPTSATAYRPQVLGHAGSGFFTPLSPFNPLPPSSMAGVMHALEIGAEGVEVDIQLSQDSVPMLYHNVRLDNMTNGRGCISEHPAAALTRLNYVGGKPYDWFQHERLVTLDSLLGRFARRPEFPLLHLDLHENEDCAAPGHATDRVPVLARQLARSLQRHRVPLQKVLIVTMSAATVRALRAAMPEVPIGLEITAYFNQNLRVAQAQPVQAVVLDANRVTLAQAEQVHAAGLRVVIFGGRSAGNIRAALACRPDAWEVDNVGRLLAILD